MDAVQWEIRSRAEYTRSHFFFDPLSSFKIRLKPAYRWLRTNDSRSGIAGEGEISLERIDFLFPWITGTASTSYAVERFESYSISGPKLRLSVRRPILDERIIIGLAWNLSWMSFPSTHNAIVNNDNIRQNWVFPNPIILELLKNRFY